MKKNIFIIGSKGIPANYGGFETFVDKLTENRNDTSIQYHVSCLADNNDEFKHNEARCFNVSVPNIGAAKAVYYDIKALQEAIKYIEKNNMNNSVIYILACRIGPFMWIFKRKIKKLGIKIFVNPDGHEWKRGKWNKYIKKYWKISEKYMVKNAELLICDSKNIELYIKDEYKEFNPETAFIAYGSSVERSKLENDDKTLQDWYRSKGVSEGKYYLVVGRFVPENNYETIIKEFIKSNTKKDLVLITNVENNSFYKNLEKECNFSLDRRVKFVGTVYNEELLKKIRENAYGYLHGHEVGGTNPSLLEALSSTKINILYNVGFNREVAEDGAVYFSKEDKNLAHLIDNIDKLEKEKIDELACKAKTRIIEYYSWDKIVESYEDLFNKTFNI